MTDRKFYLEDIPLEEARSRWQSALAEAGLAGRLGSERVPLEAAGGRVTAEACFAQGSVPHYHAAAMDGYAIRAGSTQGANDRNPITLALGEEAVPVDTGDPVPDWADSVVPIEQVEPVGEVSPAGEAREAIRLRAGLTPWQHVRPMGEDMVATELVLPAGQKLRPVDLGALAAAGYSEVSVARRPKVAILPTGDELVPTGQTPEAGQIIESNSLMLARQVEEWGGVSQRLPAVPDQKEAIAKSVRQASREHDLVLILAGSSAGSEDFTAQVVSQLGDLLVHGIAVRPGHPVILGMIHSEDGAASTPVIGVPGYPVSAALTGEIFLEPLLARWLGTAPKETVESEAVLSRKIHSRMGDDEYLRVALAQIDGELIAQPLSRGAGVISSLVRADGLLIIPAGVQGYEAGDRVGVRLYRPEAEIERAIMVQGSHDLTLDLMAQHLAKDGLRLTSANIGSLGGLIALRRGYSHLAGAHLLDLETGDYNVSYIEEYLPDQEIVVLGLVEREQGLILPNGNPKGIKELQDLTRADVRFVNRQRGAGTRLLLDYHLGEAGIDPKTIDGYRREQYTHMAVAAAVQSGAADCGLGIRAAAAALNLDFVHLFQERYDLVIPRRHYESPRLKPLLAALQDATFRSEVESMPGYGVQPMGKIIAEFNAV